MGSECEEFWEYGLLIVNKLIYLIITIEVLQSLVKALAFRVDNFCLKTIM